jgi:hypothetical protein
MEDSPLFYRGFFWRNYAESLKVLEKLSSDDYAGTALPWPEQGEVLLSSPLLVVLHRAFRDHPEDQVEIQEIAFFPRL